MEQHKEQREAITLENDGKKIFGIFHRPVGVNNVPAVIICPGFGGNKSGKFRIFVSLAQELAKRGIAVLRFDYRGSGDSEGESGEITIEGKLKDTLLCLDFLAKDDQIDSKRIGLLGRSLGGAIAVLAARQHSQVKSLALWAPVFKSDPWRDLWLSVKNNRDKLDQVKHDMIKNLPAGIPNPEFLNQFFKLDLEQELQTLQHVPLLHIHGAQDQIVKIEHAQSYKQARQNSSNTRFIELPLSDHDFSETNEQKLAITETFQWYKQTL